MARVCSLANSASSPNGFVRLFRSFVRSNHRLLICAPGKHCCADAGATGWHRCVSDDDDADRRSSAVVAEAQDCRRRRRRHRLSASLRDFASQSQAEQCVARVARALGHRQCKNHRFRFEVSACADSLDVQLCVFVARNSPLRRRCCSRTMTERVALAHRIGVGRPAYMAPEILSLQPHSVQSDIYAFAMTLYVLVAHEEPYANLSSHWDIVQAITSNVRPPIVEKYCSRQRPPPPPA